MKIKSMLLSIVCLLPALASYSEIVTETVDYDHDGAICEGTFVYDNAVAGARPGVIIYHQWSGPGEYEIARAKMLAENGYAAFVADIYTKAIRPKTFEEKRVLTTAYRGDRQMTRARANAALAAIKARPEVDPEHIAAIGYCFGGMVALELGRSGAPVKAIASIHGNLNSPTPEDAKNFKADVLVQHGADDPYVTQAELATFTKEMQDAGVKVEVIQYEGAVHAFTDWNAGNDPKSGVAYNEAADKKAWPDLLSFLGAKLK